MLHAEWAMRWQVASPYRFASLIFDSSRAYDLNHVACAAICRTICAEGGAECIPTLKLAPMRR